MANDEQRRQQQDDDKRQRQRYEDFGGWTEDDERAATAAWAEIHAEREKARAAARRHVNPDGSAVTFTLTGPRHGAGQTVQQVSLTWANGRVMSSDASALRALDIIARGWEGHAITLEGTSHTTTTNHLSDPYSAYELMHRVFAAPPTMTSGGLPPIVLHDLPEGEIP